MADGKALDRAELLFDLGRYDDADPLLAKLLAVEPDHKRGQMLHGDRATSATAAAELAAIAARRMVAALPGFGRRARRTTFN